MKLKQKSLAIAATSACLILLSGCASQTHQVEELESELRASQRALEECQARSSDAVEQAERAEERAEELRQRSEELERRMARMEERMSGKG